jgi:hypothetical protein
MVKILAYWLASRCVSLAVESGILSPGYKTEQPRNCKWPHPPGETPRLYVRRDARRYLW